MTGKLFGIFLKEKIIWKKKNMGFI